MRPLNNSSLKILSLMTNKHATYYKYQISALDKNGVNIKTVAPPKQSFDRNSRLNISRTPKDYLKFYYDIIKCQKDEFDIVHANNGLTSPFAFAQRFRPIVLTFWGSDLMKNHTTLCQKTAKYADAVILPSKSMVSYLESDFSVIPFGVDTDKFAPIPQSKARQEIGWEQDKNIVLFPCSKSRPVKNYPLAKQVVEEIEGAEIYQISGVSHKDIPLYMNASDCVLITSKRESGPMVVKEAALCNVPVVSTDVGFASDMLSDVRNSYVCSTEKELTDRVEAVIESGDRSDGHKHAENWGIDKMGKRIIDVYETVLDDQ